VAAGDHLMQAVQRVAVNPTGVSPVDDILFQFVPTTRSAEFPFSPGVPTVKEVADVLLDVFELNADFASGNFGRPIGLRQVRFFRTRLGGLVLNGSGVGRVVVSAPRRIFHDWGNDLFATAVLVRLDDSYGSAEKQRIIFGDVFRSFGVWSVRIFNLRGFIVGRCRFRRWCVVLRHGSATCSWRSAIASRSVRAADPNY